MLEKDPRVVASEVLSDELRAMRDRGQKARAGGGRPHSSGAQRTAWRRCCCASWAERSRRRLRCSRLLLRPRAARRARVKLRRVQAEIEAMYAGGGGGDGRDAGERTLSGVVVRKIVRGDFL